MPSFEEDHKYLLELLSICELTSQYSLDYTFASIDSEISKNSGKNSLMDQSHRLHKSIAPPKTGTLSTGPTGQSIICAPTWTDKNSE